MSRLIRIGAVALLALLAGCSALPAALGESMCMAGEGQHEASAARRGVGGPSEGSEAI